jgi:hypothetical protein
MATINTTNAQTFVSGDEVTPTKLNALGLPTVTVSDIVNADISASAAIALSKLGSMTAGTVLLGNASNVATATAITGDITVTSAGVTAIGNTRITAPKLDGVGKDIAGANMSVGTAPVFGVRAWVRFDTTRNAADTGASSDGQPVKIYGAGNVSSVTRNSVGKYTVNFTTAALHTNYVAVGSQNTNDNSTGNSEGPLGCHTHALGSVQVLCTRDDGQLISPKTASVCVIY